MKVKVAVFDLDGTLYKSSDYEKFLLRAIEVLVAEMLHTDFTLGKRLFRETMRVQGTVARTVETLGLSGPEFYLRLSERVKPESFIKPDDKVTSLLRFLHACGVKVVLHTNSGRPLVLKVLRALGLEETFFDFLVTSDVQSAKPSPAGYLHILYLTGAKPAEVVYIGDRYDIEVEPASRLGMKTILIGRRKKTFIVDYAVSSIDEVKRILS